MVEQVNTQKFDELISGDKTVVCDFFATWCAPCKMLSPVMDKVSEKFENAVFVKVDIDNEFELAARYGIRSIPFVAVFKGGEISGKTLGYMNEDEAEEFLTENL